MLSGALAGTTYGLVHHYLLGERESSAVHQAYSDARVLKRDLAYAGANPGEALSSLTGAQGNGAFVFQHGEWYSASVSVGTSTATSRPGSLPAGLVRMVLTGVPAQQRVVIAGQPEVAVGVPLASVDAYFFEIESLSELSSTLGLLAIVLCSCALATTLGGLLVGRWASRRLVRPLSGVAAVAAAIAGGALDQRLAPTDDPDIDGLAHSFNEMVEALQQRMKRDARFASDVSHELRSPLTTVQAAVELLEGSRDDLSPDGRKALDLLSSEVSRFSTMVQDLLEMARADAGATATDMEEIALDDLVVHTVAAYTDGAVPVVVAPGAVGTWVLGDRRRLQRVLVNLLDNAAAYAGGATEVRVERRAGRALVTVEDAGPGVPPDERHAIFDRFYRGASAGQRTGASGSGLGLALVAEHVRAHEGSVQATDRPGGGARFVVSLPVAWGEGGNGA